MGFRFAPLYLLTDDKPKNWRLQLGLYLPSNPDEAADA